MTHTQAHIHFILKYCREPDSENSVYSLYRQNLSIYSTSPTFTINTSFWGRLRRMHNFFEKSRVRLAQPSQGNWLQL